MTSAALLAFGERGGLLFAAWAVHEDRWGLGTAAALVASGCFLGGRVLDHVVRSNVERRLLAAFAQAVLEGNTLDGTTEGLQRTFIDGLDAAQATTAQNRPLAWANAGALTVGMGVLAATQGFSNFALAAATVAVASAIVWAIRRPLVRRQAEHLVAVQRAYADFLPLLSGRHHIALAGAAERCLERLRESARAAQQASRRAAFAVAVTGRVPSLMVLALVTMMVRLRGVPLTELPLLGAALLPFSGLVLALVGLSRARTPLRELQAVLATPPRVVGLPPPAEIAAVAFAGVSATYPGAPGPALRDVALVLDRPGLVVVTGPNGSGKSTVLRALAGVVPVAGDLRVNGRALHEHDVVAWRRSIAILPQRPFLLGGTTVEANMRLFDDVSRPQALAVLAELGLLPSLQAKSPGDPLAVAIDELSGGERQRVALARALARDTTLFVLDEPEASLDVEGVAQLARALRARASSALVVVAAHGAELVKSADRVVHLDHGQVTRIEARVTPPSRVDTPPSPAASTTAAS